MLQKIPEGIRPSGMNHLPASITIYQQLSLSANILGFKPLCARIYRMVEYPIRYSSTSRAHSLPSSIAQTTRD